MYADLCVSFNKGFTNILLYVILSGSLTTILNSLVIALNPNLSLALTVKANFLSMLVVPPSKEKLLLSIVVKPRFVPLENCLTLPTISPLKFNASPGGKVPAVTSYSNIALGTEVVALTENVLIKFALILPSVESVFQLIVLSTSPKILTVNVFAFSANTVLIEVYLIALTVNLNSLVMAGWYGTLPVSYTHLTLPTRTVVDLTVVGG